MKKTLAALAVLGAFAGSAAAADVQLYGVVDEGLIYTNTKVTDEKSVDKLELKSGRNLGSRWGLKGSEDLGNGYKVGFKLESGFEADSGTLQENRLFRREAGLTLYGPFGSLGLGRFGGAVAMQNKIIEQQRCPQKRRERRRQQCLGLCLLVPLRQRRGLSDPALCRSAADGSVLL